MEYHALIDPICFASVMHVSNLLDFFLLFLICLTKSGKGILKLYFLVRALDFPSHCWEVTERPQVVLCITAKSVVTLDKELCRIH